MAIIVHDGSEGSQYNSFASLEAADAYQRARKNDAWSDYDDDEREAALVRATDYLDVTYALPAPVEGVLHPLIERAAIVLAVYALTDDFFAKVERAVLETEEELSGVTKERVKYDTNAPNDPYPMITRLLAPITGQSSGRSVTVGRIIR